MARSCLRIDGQFEYLASGSSILQIARIDQAACSSCFRRIEGILVIEANDQDMYSICGIERAGEWIPFWNVELLSMYCSSILWETSMKEDFSNRTPSK